MSDWVCYLIMSLDSNDTYVGSSNNQPKRLYNHNRNDNTIRRVGAKRTRGQTWIPVLVISGFQNKNSCLSFESGWKRLCHKRSNQRLKYINIMAGTNYGYTKATVQGRILDLMYFVHNITLLDTKFKLNHSITNPIVDPNVLYMNVFSDDNIDTMPWPYFIIIKKN